MPASWQRVGLLLVACLWGDDWPEAVGWRGARWLVFSCQEPWVWADCWMEGCPAQVSLVTGVCLWRLECGAQAGDWSGVVRRVDVRRQAFSCQGLWGWAVRW
jgi:hypothetical protein